MLEFKKIKLKSRNLQQLAFTTLCFTEPEKTGPPHLPGKKPVLPPPVGKKPAKPDPPRPTSDGKSHMVGGSKDEPVSHKDTHKDIPQNGQLSGMS